MYHRSTLKGVKEEKDHVYPQYYFYEVGVYMNIISNYNKFHGRVSMNFIHFNLFLLYSINDVLFFK